ncbi:MAG: caspase family protein [Verrucomicrobiota bacterium]
MPKPFIKLTIDEFEELVGSFNFTRVIDGVHMHHTWKPNHSQYRGLQTINAMWEFHTQTNGWSDIAQHVSIAPDGSIWTGRNWNQPPASAAGYNGNSKKGPFMFEMIGDFDKGKDAFADPQKAAVIRVIESLLAKFSLPVSALRFHNHMTDQKSCPGTAIGYDAFCKEIKAGGAATKGVKKRGGVSPLVEEVRGFMEISQEVDLGAPEYHADHLHFSEEEFTSRSARAAGGPVNAEAHLINLRDGRLSQSGMATTSEATLESLFKTHLPAALDEAKAAGRPLRVMFFAHGGLNDEKGSVATALSRVPWWLENDIYPIFFIWETGLMETLGQMLERKTNDVWGRIGGLFGRRGVGDFIADHATDPAIEKLARSIGGVALWGAMKDSAERASAANTGGAWLTARHLKEFLKTTKDHPVELHAIGHSAGSIFHAHFLDAVTAALGAKGPTIRSLHHLAPAIRVDLFKQKVLPLLGKGIDRLTMFTMTDPAEREDICMKVYKKSLLYLIHYGLEPEARCPLVGLQQSVRADATLRNLFEPEAPGVVEVIWSPTQGGPRHSSESLTHGGFDDDPRTMNSVCRRILGRDDIREYNVRQRAAGPEMISQEPTDEEIALGILTAHALRRQGAAAPALAVPAAEVVTEVIPAPNIIVRQSGNRHALCIGIDAYPEERDRLNGCANDTRKWHDYFNSLGFNTQRMLNEEATYQAILENLRGLVTSAKPGDMIAVQYAGHGTQITDQDGDDKDDGKDEALCCHDFRTGRLVLDDDLKEIALSLNPQASLSFFFDSCHSGTATRNMVTGPHGSATPAGAVRRMVFADRELNEAHAAFYQSLPKAKRAHHRALRRGASDPYEGAVDILFAAALPHQFAHEIHGGGVFTETAMKVLSSNGAFTNTSFMNAVREIFPESFSNAQEPKLYASTAQKPKPFLGGLR